MKITEYYLTKLFVSPTPGGTLMKDLQKREAEINKNDEDRVKFIEKGGIKINKAFVRTQKLQQIMSRLFNM